MCYFDATGSSWQRRSLSNNTFLDPSSYLMLNNSRLSPVSSAHVPSLKVQSVWSSARELCPSESSNIYLQEQTMNTSLASSIQRASGLSSHHSGQRIRHHRLAGDYRPEEFRSRDLLQRMGSQLIFPFEEKLLQQVKEGRFQKPYFEKRRKKSPENRVQTKVSQLNSLRRSQDYEKAAK